MSGLFGSLSIALRSLQAQQGALQTTAQNIANVNTPGYSRQVPVLQEEPPLLYGSVLLGTGVSLEKVASIRDRILGLRIYQETQQQGQLQAFLGPAQQVQTSFSLTDTGGLQAALSNFFGSLSQLSASPTDLASRQNVIAAGQNLASTFQQTASQLTQVQGTLDQGVTQSVDQINQLTAQIAKLNAQVSTVQASGQDAGALADSRDQLISQLSGLVDVAVVDAGNGNLTLTTTNGAALVVGNSSYSLAAQADPATGHQHVLAQGVDITATLQGGQIGGLLKARDQFIPSVQSSLDDLAANLGQTFNTVHHAGFDLSGAPGGNFFVPFVPTTPGSNAGAAASFAVALTDPKGLAASSDGTPGNNTNLKALAAIQNQAIVANQSPTDFYAGLVSQIGNQVAGSLAEFDAGKLTLTQLQNQQSSVSGVSLDEEATNLIRYQRAYEAAARVVNVVNTLTQTAINLGIVSATGA